MPAEVTDKKKCLGAENEPSVYTLGSSGASPLTSMGKSGKAGKSPLPLISAKARFASKCEFHEWASKMKRLIASKGGLNLPGFLRNRGNSGIGPPWSVG